MSNKKPSKLVLLLISLVSLFAVGCGDSREEYVFTGTAPGTSTGTLTFNFEQQQVAAQEAGLVPAGTQTLGFEFYTNTAGNNADLVYQVTRPYASTVTIDGVPTTAVFVRVTAYGANNVPLAVLTGNFTVQAGANVAVDLSAPAAVTFESIGVSPDAVTLSLAANGNETAQLVIVGNFSNIQSVTFPTNSFVANADFSSSNEAVATVSDSGLIEAVGNGVANITTTYTLNGVSRSDSTIVTVTGGLVDVDTLVISPSTLTIAPGNTSADLSAEFFAAGSSTGTNVDGNVTYTLQVPVTGITVNETTGAVTVAETVSNTTTATVVGTYTTPTGNNVTDTVSVNVGEFYVVSVTPVGSTTVALPQGTIFGPLLDVELSDGRHDLVSGTQAREGYLSYDVALTSSNTTAVTVLAGGGLQLNDVSGNSTATVAISVNNVSSSSTLSVTTLDIDTYTVDVTASPTVLDAGEQGVHQVVLNYGNRTQDVSLYIAPANDTLTGDADVDFLYNRVSGMWQQAFEAVGSGTVRLYGGEDSIDNDLMFLGGTPIDGQTVTITVNGDGPPPPP